MQGTLRKEAEDIRHVTHVGTVERFSGVGEVGICECSIVNQKTP